MSQPGIKITKAGNNSYMFRSYSKKEEVTKEDLINDPDFYSDAQQFLLERNGVTKSMSPEDTYDAFMEHMRYHNVNEVTTLRDLEYAQNASVEGKLRFASLIDTFDKLDGEVSLNSALDYVEGIATAPSTYLGIFTGGLGKGAAVGATQVAKVGVRKILGQAARRSAQAAAVEGAIGFGQGVAQEEVRTETGLQSENNIQRAVNQGGISAATAGLINFPIQIAQSRKANRANELYEKSQLLQSQKATKASEKTKQVLEQAKTSATKKAEATKIKSTLEALDPDKVRKGRQIRQSTSSSEILESGLPLETIENITAAAIRAKDELNIGPNERVTSALQRAISENKLEKIDAVERILDEHNLTYDEFSLFYLAEFSDAGRTLKSAADLEAAIKPRGIGKRKAKADKTTAEAAVDETISAIDGLHKAGKSGIDADQAKQIANERNGAANFFRSLDRYRLGSMTSQPATTARNNINASFRVAVDASVRAFDNILNLKQNPLTGTGDVAKYLLNPYEARAISNIFKETFPVEGSRLFREAADLEARTSGENGLALVGRKLNILNTVSDNIFKRAVLSAALNRRIGDATSEFTEESRKLILKNRMIKRMDEAAADDIINKADADQFDKLYKQYVPRANVYDVIETGQFGKISDDIIKGSIEDAYEFVYQASPKGGNLFGDLAKSVIKGHADYPFIISALMPFPRYIANQLKAQFEYAPIFGMLPLERLGSKQGMKGVASLDYIKQKLPKQITGGLMFAAAYGWRAKQGDTEYWYQFKDNNGNVIDGRPVYGPFSTFMLAADLVYRYQKGTLPTEITPYIRDVLQATLGSTFRVGLGYYAIDKLYTDIAGGQGQKAFAEGLSSVGNSFLIPVSAARDIYAQFDQDARGIPETRNGETNFLDILYNRATRSLPKNFMSQIDDAEKGIRDYIRESAFFGQDEKRARSPFQTGPLMQINPLEKQLFGFSKRPRKNLLQREMGKLNLQAMDLYKRDRNELLDNYIRDELSKEDGPLNSVDRMREVIESPYYKSLQDNAEDTAIKRDILERQFKDLVKRARDRGQSRIEQDAADVDAPYTETDRVKWVNKTNATLKARIDSEYKKLLRRAGEDAEGRTVSEDMDKTVQLESGRMNVLQWALTRVSEIRGEDL